MAHVIPTLRTAFHPTYTPPVVRRRPDTPPSTDKPAPPPDFSTELKNQTDPAPASRMIGSVNLGSPVPVATTPATTTCPMASTAQELFGANPWSTNASGTGPGGSYNYNHYYFAPPQTAAKVAQMLGGTVVAMDAITPYGPSNRISRIKLVQMPDGRQINAGLVAGFYDHGHTQQTVDKTIAAEVSGTFMFTNVHLKEIYEKQSPTPTGDSPFLPCLKPWASRRKPGDRVGARCYTRR